MHIRLVHSEVLRLAELEIGSSGEKVGGGTNAWVARDDFITISNTMCGSVHRQLKRTLIVAPVTLCVPCATVCNKPVMLLFVCYLLGPGLLGVVESMRQAL